MSKERWTDQQLKDLRFMYEDPQFTIEEIATKTGRSYDAVVKKASREGYKRPVFKIWYRKDPDNEDTTINYDPSNNTIIFYRPVDIDELLNKIIEIKTGISPGDLE